MLTLTFPDELPIIGVPVLPGYWQVLRIATLLTFAGHVIVGGTGRGMERLKVKEEEADIEDTAIK